MHKHFILPIFAVAFLLCPLELPAFAQSGNFDPVKNKPIVVEFLQQLDSPISMTLLGVDTSPGKPIKINFTAQNFGQKKIEQYALLLNTEGNKNSGIISLTRAIDSGQIIEGSVSELRDNLRNSSKLIISVDYVAFTDGTSWGKDSKHESELIKGADEGRKTALSKIKELLIDSDKNALPKLLQSENFEVDPSLIDKNRSENWRLSFSTSYRSLLLDVQTIYKQQGLGAFLTLINTNTSLASIESRKVL
jgi:hypothetical protein